MQPSPRADTASPLFPSARFFISPPPGFRPGNRRTRLPSVLRVEFLLGNRKVHDSLDQARHAGEDCEDPGGDAPADAARALEGRLPHAAPGADLRPGVDVGPAVDAILSL